MILQLINFIYDETKSKKKYGQNNGINNEFADQDNRGAFTTRYDRQHCATLKVPCRFVSDHSCCRFKVKYKILKVKCVIF